MISLALFVWSLPIIFAVERVFIPYFRDLIEEKRWARLHPGMESYRRVRS
jgi:hypothetical protein